MKNILNLMLISSLLILNISAEENNPGNIDAQTDGGSLPIRAFSLECGITELTTEHNIPFDLTCNIVNNEGDPITGVGAVDENGDPLGTCTLEGDQIHWVFDPPCSWVTDGLNHTVNLYLENEGAGIVYPDVVFETISLIVTNSPPVISGPCNETRAITYRHTMTAVFEAADPNGDDIYSWSYTVGPALPTGPVELIDGVLSFSPCPSDEGSDFVFSVEATDCAGAYSSCEITAHLISCDCYWHDPNSDGTFDILDIVFLINYVYKGGPAPAYLPAGDWNLDEAIDILDIIYLINFLYKDGPFAKHYPIDCG